MKNHNIRTFDEIKLSGLYVAKRGFSAVQYVREAREGRVRDWVECNVRWKRREEERRRRRRSQCGHFVNGTESGEG